MSKKLKYEDEAEKVLAMTDEEVLELCRSRGEDPAVIANRMDAAFRRAIEEYKSKKEEQDA